MVTDVHMSAVKLTAEVCLISAKAFSLVIVYLASTIAFTFFVAWNGVLWVQDFNEILEPFILNDRKRLTIFNYHVHQGLIQLLLSGHCVGERLLYEYDTQHQQ